MSAYFCKIPVHIYLRIKCHFFTWLSCPVPHSWQQVWPTSAQIRLLFSLHTPAAKSQHPQTQNYPRINMGLQEAPPNCALSFSQCASSENILFESATDLSVAATGRHPWRILFSYSTSLPETQPKHLQVYLLQWTHPSIVETPQVYWVSVNSSGSGLYS